MGRLFPSVLCCTALALTRPIHASLGLDDRFDVIRDGGPGACSDKYYSMLLEMFPEMQKVSRTAYARTRNRSYLHWPRIVDDIASFFGIYSGTLDGAYDEHYPVPPTQRFQQLQSWTQTFDDFMNNAAAENFKVKPQLYCDSTFARPLTSEDRAPRSAGAFRHESVASFFNRVLAVPMEDPSFYDRPLLYGNIIKEGGAWFPSPEAPDEAGDDFRDPRTGRWTWCSHPGNEAITFHGNDHEPSILVLCPSLFTKSESNVLDLTEQPAGRSLAAMEPKWKNFYREIFHIVFPWDAVNAPAWIVRDTLSDGLTLDHLTKQMFVPSSHQASGPTQSMAVALRDNSPPFATHLSEYEAIRAPESYTWFSITTFIRTWGQGNQNWALGYIPS